MSTNRLGTILCYKDSINVSWLFQGRRGLSLLSSFTAQSTEAKAGWELARGHQMSRWSWLPRSGVVKAVNGFVSLVFFFLFVPPPQQETEVSTTLSFLFSQFRQHLHHPCRDKLIPRLSLFPQQLLLWNKENRKITSGLFSQNLLTREKTNFVYFSSAIIRYTRWLHTEILHGFNSNNFKESSH